VQNIYIIQLFDKSMALDDNLFHSNHGLFVLIHGPMFSGKTEELVAALSRAQNYAKLNVQAFKPIIDHRYGENNIVTHNGVHFPAIEVKDSKECYKHLNSNIQVIGIDEVQFFDEGIIDFILEQRKNKKIVIAEGLFADYKQEPFRLGKSTKTMADLLVHANYAIQKTAFCFACGKPALYTMRLAASSELVLIGGAKDYVAACPDHYALPDLNKK
jgi:thymidine kinase